MKKNILLLVLVAFAFFGRAQNKPHNQVGISLGWQNFRFLDQHVSPLMYGTNSVFPKVGLFYNKQTDNSFMEIHVSTAFGNLNPSRFGARNYKTQFSATDSFQYKVTSQYIHANIEATYFRKIKSLSNDKFNYWLGGSINETAYYGDEIANMPWILNVADIAPAFKFNYLPAVKHSINVRVDISVFGLITRPIYALFSKSNKDKNVTAYFKQGTHASTIDKFQKINFQLSYQYQVTKHFAAGVEYSLKWMHYALPKDVRAIDKHFDVNFSYTY